MLIVVAQFPDKSWSGGGSILDSDYANATRYFCPGSACNGSVDDAIDVVKRLTRKQREMLLAVTNAVMEANDRGATVSFPWTDKRSIESMLLKGVFVLADGAEIETGKDFVVRLNN